MGEPEKERARVRIEDVDDVVEIASELHEEERRRAESLDLDELKEVVEGVGLKGELVEPALGELDRRREAEAERQAAARLEKAHRVRVLTAVGVATLGLLAAAGVLGNAAAGQLRGELALVEQRRAQVRTALERQERMEARFGSLPSTPERDAELVGAENRVTVERTRYDEQAAQYNAEAGRFPNGIVAPIFGLPSAVPASNHVEEW